MRKVGMKNRNHSEFYRQLGDMIRQHRDRPDHRITQEQLAQRVGLSRVSVVNVEKGRQHLAVHQLYTFAAALNVKPEALLPRPAGSASWIVDKLPAGTEKSIQQWAKKLA